MTSDSADTPQTPAPDVTVIVAAYNEAPRIEATLVALAAAFPGAQVWVADDGSTDATSEVASRAGARVVRSERMIGKGAAVTLAARDALEDARNARNARTHTHAHVRARAPNQKSDAIYDDDTAGRDALGGDRVREGEPSHDREASNDDERVFILCDGDLGESAGRLGALADAVRRGETDIAVAAFATRLGGGVGLAVGFARWAIRRRCGLSLRAPISGQRALRAEVLADVLPFADGFGMEIGITIDAARAGHRIAEVELDLTHRATGRTVSGFLHRGRQLGDFVRVYLARRERHSFLARRKRH
jgi:glycosyltransferase involved in cell wall biosynthesis